jgi:hypothetical protein
MRIQLNDEGDLEPDGPSAGGRRGNVAGDSPSWPVMNQTLGRLPVTTFSAFGFRAFLRNCLPGFQLSIVEVTLK